MRIGIRTPSRDLSSPVITRAQCSDVVGHNAEVRRWSWRALWEFIDSLLDKTSFGFGHGQFEGSLEGSCGLISPA